MFSHIFIGVKDFDRALSFYRALMQVLELTERFCGWAALGGLAIASRSVGAIRMITLFHSPNSRSSRMIFLLEELEAPYEIKLVGIRRGDGSGTLDPANPHPHGKVPVIRDDSVVVYESPAIALYLTDKYPKNHLGPLVGEPERGGYLTWLSYYTGVFEPAVVSKFMKIEVPRGTAGWVALDELMPVILNALSLAPYLLGERFSAADVLYGTTFALFAQSALLPKSPLIDDYVQRIVARPAYQRAQAREQG